MKRTILLTAALLAVATTVHAQPPADGGQPGGPGMRPTTPMISALDADHDGTISADEMKNAPAALLTLDKNGDGKLSEEEYRPARPQGGPGGGLGQGGPGGAQRGRPEGGGAGGRGQQGGPGAGGPGAGGRQAPSPDQFATRAMEFDADKDGKLDSSELKKFAESFGQRRGGGGPQGAGSGNSSPSQNPDRPARPE